MNLRPMKDISLEERRAILFDSRKMKGRALKEKYSISTNVLAHIKFFHGKPRSENPKNYYHKDLVSGQEDPDIEHVRRLKSEGKTSEEASVATNIPLSEVNKMWSGINVS